MSDEQNAEPVEEADVVDETPTDETPEADAPVVQTLEATVVVDGADRIAELEARVAEQDAYIAELEADPYRPIVGGQFGEVTEGLTFFEQQSYKAEVQALQRSGDITDAEAADALDPVVESQVEV